MFQSKNVVRSAFDLNVLYTTSLLGNGLCQLCKLNGHKIGVVHMRKAHMHYHVRLAYLKYT